MATQLTFGVGSSSSQADSPTRTAWNEEQIQKCQGFLGYSPPNLFESERTENLNHSVRPVILALDIASQSLCHSLLSIQICRVLTTEILKKMGHNATCRGVIVNVSLQLSSLSAALELRKNTFVSYLGKVCQTMGTALTLLQFGADVPTIAQFISKLDMKSSVEDLADESGEIDTEALLNIICDSNAYSTAQETVKQLESNRMIMKTDYLVKDAIKPKRRASATQEIEFMVSMLREEQKEPEPEKEKVTESTRLTESELDSALEKLKRALSDWDAMFEVKTAREFSNVMQLLALLVSACNAANSSGITSSLHMVRSAVENSLMIEPLLPMLQSEKASKKLVSSIIMDLQTCCEIGAQVIDAPGKAIIMTDYSQALTQVRLAMFDNSASAGDDERNTVDVE